MLDVLPLETLLQIISNIEYWKDIIALKKTCKRINNIIIKNHQNMFKERRISNKFVQFDDAYQINKKNRLVKISDKLGMHELPWKYHKQYVINYFNDLHNGHPLYDASEEYVFIDYIDESVLKDTIHLIIDDNTIATKFIEEQTEEIAIEAVKRTGFLLKFVKKQHHTEKVCHYAINNNIYAIKYVIDKNYEICLRAVQFFDRDFMLDNFIKHIPLEHRISLREIIVGKSGHAIRFIPNEYITQELCIEAVKNSSFALQYIDEKKQTEYVCKKAIDHCSYFGLTLSFIINQTPEICIHAIQQNCRALEFVKDQTQEICMYAIKQNAYALKYVRNQTPEICIQAVQQDGRALEFVKDQTQEICMYAIQQTYAALKFIKDVNLQNRYRRTLV